MNRSSKFTIVQVGANDGVTVDPVRPFALEFAETTSLFLIETQPELVVPLRSAYSSHPDVTIGIFAIGDRKTLRLWRIAPEVQKYYRHTGGGSGKTSFDEQYVRRKAQRNLPRKIIRERIKRGGDVVEPLDVPCFSLPQAFAEVEKEPACDWLQVDTEGFDDTVIYSSDVGVLRPIIISYEFIHLPPERRSRLRGYLSKLGYVVYPHSESDEVGLLNEASGLKCNPNPLNLNDSNN